MGEGDLKGILAELARQRRDLEQQLDQTGRSQQSTNEIVQKIDQLKARAEELSTRKIPQR
jgi:hypothetical protein